MRILLTNDDGFYAPGLRALRTELKKLGDVRVVAPATEQSAAGHSVTLLAPLLVNEVFEDDGVTPIGWAVEGRPADCVKLALLELATGAVRLELDSPDNEQVCLALSPNGRWLASGSIDRSVVLWDLTGRQAGVDTLIPLLGPLDTSHTVSNLQIEISDDSATLSAYVMSQHFMPRQGSRRGSENALLMNRYDCELVRDGQKWRFKRVTIDNAWAQGNPEILNALAIQRALATKTKRPK